MENYKNLNFSAEQINQKLAWVGDKSKLATTLQETPVNQFMFTKDQKTLKTIIDANNQIITVETNDMITEPGSKLESWNVYVDHLLCINSIAPTYVTCQATGYKLISNKEQPSGNAYRIPWLLAYFPAATSSSNPKENTAQHKPMYIKYDVSDTNIKITAVQINGIWEVDSSSTKYDFNNQIENLTIDKMTLSTSTEEDLAIYSPDNQNFYTLKLQ